MRSMRSLVQNFTRHSEFALVAALVAQVSITEEGVALALAAVRGNVHSSDARDHMSDIEHRGDQERARAVGLLSRSLTSPIDREDLFRLSRSIDDVLDNLRDFVREHDLFGLGADPILVTVLEAIDDGVTNLADAVAAISENVGGIREATLSIRKNEIRRRYQVAVAELLDGDITSEALKCRELLRRLDVVGLRLGEAADALADGAMKRSH